MLTIEDALLACRTRRPYYSVALAAMCPIEKPSIPTLAVDKWWRLYYNPEYVGNLTPDQAAACIEHEVSHLLRDHNGRRERTCEEPMRWNYAADLEINDDLENLPPGLLHPDKFGFPKNLLAEEYLDLLPPAQPCSGNCSGGSGAGNPLEDEADAPADGKTPGVSEAEAEKIIQRVAEDVINDCSASAGLKIWAEAKVIKPRRITLREALLRAMTVRGNGSIRTRTWTRPPRRSREGILKPGSLSRSAQRAVLLDCSGSMFSVMQPALEACLGLFRDDSESHLYGCDGGSLQRLQPTLAGLRRANGGGGSGFEEPMAKLYEKYRNIVVVTDGFATWGDQDPAVHVSFIVVDKRGTTPDWAKNSTVYIDGAS